MSKEKGKKSGPLVRYYEAERRAILAEVETLIAWKKEAKKK